MKTSTTNPCLSTLTAAWLIALASAPVLFGCSADAGGDEEMVGEASGAIATEICNGVDDDLDLMIDEGGVCQFGARQRYQSHEYLKGDTSLPWSTALAACRGRGLDLVKIDDGAENDFLAQLIAGETSNRWIGLSDMNDDDILDWTDGSAVGYTNWAKWKIPMPATGYGYMTPGGVWWIDGTKASARPSFCELFDPATFANAVGVTVNGTWITKTSGTNAGASSTQSITSGDGFVQFTTAETNKRKAAGLGSFDANQTIDDIEFAIRLDEYGLVRVFESGIDKGVFGGYAADDVFRVEVLGGKVRYVRNGNVFHTSSATPTYPLSLDSHISHNGGTLGDARLRACGASDCVSPGFWNGVTSVFAGSSHPTEGNFLVRNTGTSGSSSGASSYATIESGDGYVEFTTLEANKRKAAGLGNGDANQTIDDIEYAIRLDEYGQVRVYESGTDRGYFGNYVAGDVFRVELLSGQVRFVKNGVVFHSSSIAPVYPLRLDTHLLHDGATITKASIAACTGCITPGYWTNVRSAFAGTNAASGNYLTSLGGTSGASSFATIDAGDGYVEFTTQETNKRKAAGLGNGDDSQLIDDIEYAIRLDEYGQVRVYESGFDRGYFGNYVAGDVFRVEALAGQVRYLKNGVVFHSSSVAPVYPLRLDTHFLHAGATITNASILACTGCITPGYWTNVNSAAAVTGGALGNALTSYGGSSGASSFATVPAGNAFVQFQTQEINKRKAAGLGNGDASTTIDDIEYAIRLDEYGQVRVFESGADRGYFTTYAVGDVFRVELRDGEIRYLKNGSLFRSTAVSPTYPLRLDTHFLHAGATITNAILGTL